MKTYRSSSSFLPRPTEAVLAECILGKACIEWHGARIPLKLTPLQAEEFKAAQERGYCVGKRQEHSIFWAYGLWCDIGARPEVKVKLDRKHATVQVDMLSTPTRLCAHQQDQILDGVRAIIEDTGRVRRRYYIGASFFELEKVPLELATKLASAVWEIVQKPCSTCMLAAEEPR